MLRQVRVTNRIAETLIMPLEHPEYTGMNITAIDGLGPNNATINTTEISTFDGSIYNSARLNERNIVLHIQFYWPNDMRDLDPETIRHRTYQYFPIKQYVVLEFISDERWLWIEGYVESNEPDIFNEYEGTVISIVCPDPWFKSKDDSGNGLHTFSGTEPLFEFPVNVMEPAYYSDEDSDESPYVHHWYATNDIQNYDIAKIETDYTLADIPTAYGGVLYAGLYFDWNHEPVGDGTPPFIGDWNNDPRNAGNFRSEVVKTVVDTSASPVIQHVPRAAKDSTAMRQYNPIIFGNIVRTSSGTISYYADSEVGVIVSIKARAGTVMENQGSDEVLSLFKDAGKVYVTNRTSEQTMTIDLDKILLRNSDEIVIDTRVGHKGIRLIQDTVSYNILHVLAKDTQWLKLIKGDNYIVFHADKGDILQYLDFSITHEGLYEGV